MFDTQLRINDNTALQPRVIANQRRSVGVAIRFPQRQSTIRRMSSQHAPTPTRVIANPRFSEAFSADFSGLRTSVAVHIGAMCAINSNRACILAAIIVEYPKWDGSPRDRFVTF